MLLFLFFFCLVWMKKKSPVLTNRFLLFILIISFGHNLELILDFILFCLCYFLLFFSVGSVFVYYLAPILIFFFILKLFESEWIAVFFVSWLIFSVYPVCLLQWCVENNGRFYGCFDLVWKRFIWFSLFYRRDRIKIYIYILCGWNWQQTIVLLIVCFKTIYLLIYFMFCVCVNFI